MGRGEAERQALGRDHEARVHQQPALGVRAQVAVAVPPGRGTADRADGLGLGPTVAEPGRVLDDENGAAGGREAACGRLEVAGQDRVLAEPLAREEAVGGLRVRPVLAGQRQGRAHRTLELMEQPAQPVAQALVAERAAGQFAIDPRCPVPVTGSARKAAARS
jgi:hypothetical protein